MRDLLVDVQEVVASHGAFAARLADGHVVTWGNPLYGGAFGRVSGVGHMRWSRGVGKDGQTDRGDEV